MCRLRITYFEDSLRCSLLLPEVGRRSFPDATGSNKKHYVVWSVLIKQGVDFQHWSAVPATTYQY
jgi:hypothetical protein